MLVAEGPWPRWGSSSPERGSDVECRQPPRHRTLKSEGFCYGMRGFSKCLGKNPQCRTRRWRLKAQLCLDLPCDLKSEFFFSLEPGFWQETENISYLVYLMGWARKSNELIYLVVSFRWNLRCHVNKASSMINSRRKTSVAGEVSKEDEV